MIVRLVAGTILNTAAIFTCMVLGLSVGQLLSGIGFFEPVTWVVAGIFFGGWLFAQVEPRIARLMGWV